MLINTVMETENTQRDITREIADSITLFLTNSRFSLRYIEDKTGVSKSYISRIQNNEIPSDKIDILKIYLILKIILGAEESKTFLLNSELKDRFVKNVAIPFNILETSKFINQEEIIFLNKENYVVFSMAANKGGTNIEKLYRALGEASVSAIEMLKSYEIISLKDGDVTISDQYLAGMESVSLTSTQCKKAIPYLVNFYKPQNKHTGTNSVFTIGQNVNEQFLRNSRYKLLKIVNEIFEESKLEANHGEIPFFLAGTMDTFINVNEMRNIQ